MTEHVFSTRALVVSSGPPLSLKVLYCLAACNIRADLLDIGQPSMARYSRYCGRYARESRDVCGNGFGDTVNRRIEEWGSSIVIPADIGAIAAVHQVQTSIRGAGVFPVSSAETVDELDNKWRCYQFLRKHGIDTPGSVLIRDLENLECVSGAGVSAPWLVKPLSGESGHGIFRAENFEALRDRLRRSQNLNERGILVQEYVEGVDADISVLAVEGELVAHVIQMRRQRGRLDFLVDDRLVETARQVVIASGFTGVLNIDVRINEQSGRVVVIECNPRFWYTLQASMWGGLNFVRAGIACAMGQTHRERMPHSGVYYYHGEIAKCVLWQPWRWRDVPGYNWRGFWQALSDPRPFIANHFGRLPRMER